jgi:hypothetical protein
MSPEPQSRSIVSSLVLILIVVMLFVLIGMTLAARHILAMPYPYSLPVLRFLVGVTRRPERDSERVQCPLAIPLWCIGVGRILQRRLLNDILIECFLVSLRAHDQDRAMPIPQHPICDTAVDSATQP